MLVQFSVRNHKAIADWQTLSMVPAQSNLKNGTAAADRFLLATECFSVPYVLPVALIYGANASGKSSLLGALSECLNIMKVRNFREGLRGFREAMPQHPHRFDPGFAEAPTQYELIVAHQGQLYTYQLSHRLGLTLQESLSVRHGAKGSRERAVYTLKYNPDSDQADIELNDRVLSARAQKLKANFHPRETFVSQLFGLNSLGEVMDGFHDWIWNSNAFEDMSASNTGFGLGTYRRFRQARRPEIDRAQRAFMQQFEPSIRTTYTRMPNAIEAYQLHGLDVDIEEDVRDKAYERGDIWPIRVFARKNAAGQIEEIPYQFESYGTQQLYKLAHLIINSVEDERPNTGKLLSIDELGSALHPSVVDWLIKAYSTKSNSHGGQLLFTTHATHAMEHPLIDNDQIYFVEKDKNLAAKVYARCDFSRAEVGRVSNERAYFQGRFGALPRLRPLASLMSGNRDGEE